MNRMTTIFSLMALIMLSACQDPDAIEKSIQSMAKDKLSTTPAAVVAWGKTMMEDACSGEGFEASGEPIIIVQDDFNLDGVVDYVTSTSGLHCMVDGQESLTVWTQGQIPVWGLVLSQPDDTYDTQTFAASEIEPYKFSGQDVLLVARGGPGVQQPKYFWTAWGWDGENDVMTDLAYYDRDKNRINKDGTKFDARQQAGNVSFPPIPKGYYASNGNCAKAIASGNADMPPENLLYFHPTALIYGADGGPQISGFKDLGNNMYWVAARTYGNGEDDVGQAADFTIKVTGKSSFEMGGVSHVHCDAKMVPQVIRDNWYEFFFEQ